MFEVLCINENITGLKTVLYYKHVKILYINVVHDRPRSRGTIY